MQNEIVAGNDEVRASPLAAVPDKVASALTGLAIDLEHSDAPPTDSQRELLEYETRRFDNAEGQWKGILPHDE